MKTLEELQNDVRRYGCAFAAIERHRETREYNLSVISANLQQERLFASLATIHALAALKAQELREELEALESLRDGKEGCDRCQSAGFYNEFFPRGGNCIEWPDTLYAVNDCHINAAGLARIQEIKRLLGEGWEEG